MSLLKYLFFLTISTILLWQCASMQSPSGGAKDTHAPAVLNSYPDYGATNVNPSRIEIHFDEFFKLRNLQSELLVSPPLNEAPLISQKDKSLFIELKEELNPNSTYTFNFGNGIVDYHEGNALKDYSLVFSTGNELDSLSLRGKLISCPLETLPEDIIIGIYQKDSLVNDSTIYLQKPDYFSLAKEKGDFQIKHIRKGNFELIAFEDLNANYQYDGATEQIAFYDSLITIGDSSEFELWLFQEETELKLLESKAKKNGRIHWAFNKVVDSIKIHSSLNTAYEYQAKEDSVFIWPQFKTNDSVYFSIQVESIYDTIWVNPKSLPNPSTPIASIKNKFLKSNKWLFIDFSEPISLLDTSKISLVKDAIYYDYEFELFDFALAIEAPENGNSNYELILERGSITSHLGVVNDSTNLSFYTKAANSLASLKINVRLDNDNYFIELLKNGDVIDRLEASEELKFAEILPSKYQLRLTLDSNNDGIWTPGNYFENSQPEKVFYYKEEINLRANWELELDFILTD